MRILDFNDTFTSATEPVLDGVIVENLKVVATATLDAGSTNILTSGYTELTADVGGLAIKAIQVFWKSGNVLILATGAAASEVDGPYIFAGGSGGNSFGVEIAANARVSLKALESNTTTGTIYVNYLG